MTHDQANGRWQCYRHTLPNIEENYYCIHAGGTVHVRKHWTGLFAKPSVSLFAYDHSPSTYRQMVETASNNPTWKPTSLTAWHNSAKKCFANNLPMLAACEAIVNALNPKSE